jgi:hypothetical protein
MVVPKHISDAFDRGEATVDDIRALLQLEADSQKWSLDDALAWVQSGAAAKNYIQADIKALASLLDLCCAA